MKYPLSRFELYDELKPTFSQVHFEEIPRLSEVCDDHQGIIPRRSSTHTGNPLHTAWSFLRFDWTERDNDFEN